MKNNYQSKAVPRGTRTIWRYLSALIILFTFAVGQIWAAEETITWDGTSLTGVSSTNITAGTALAVAGSDGRKVQTIEVYSAKIASGGTTRKKYNDGWWENFYSTPCTTSGCTDASTTARIEIPFTIGASKTFEITNVSFDFNQNGGSGPAVHAFLVQGTTEEWLGYKSATGTCNYTPTDITFESGEAKLVFVLGIGANKLGDNRGFLFSNISITGDVEDSGAGPVAVTAITIAPSSATIKVGKKVTLIPTITPSNATDKAVTWAVTSGSSYASVTDAGVVTGLAEGTAVITATAHDGSGVTQTATITVEACPTSGTIYKFQLKTDLTNGNLTTSVPQDVVMTTENYLSNLTGGTLTAAARSNVNRINISNGNAIGFANGDQAFLKMDLDCAIQEGDILKYTITSNDMILMAGSETEATNRMTLSRNVAQVEVDSKLVGADALYMKRSSSSPKISYFEVFRPVYNTITLEYADGVTPDGTIKVLDGEAATKPADPTWEHHRFDGWYNGEDAYDWSANVTGNLTLTAHWTQLYTVTYAAGDGTATGDAPTQADLAAGEKFIVAANTFAVEGKDFSTWNDGANNFDPGMEYTMGSANVTLTAQWVTAATKYAITKGSHANGDFTIDPAEQAEGQKVTLAATPDEDYLFSSWTVLKTEDDSETGILVDDNGQFEMPAYAVTVNATFAADPRQKVLYLTTASTENDKLYAALKDDYNLKVQAPGSQNLTDYALVVLHESLGGSAAASGILHDVATAAVPVLNTKSYFYNNGRWSWGTPNNGKSAQKVATINDAYCNADGHPIFAGIDVTGKTVTVLTNDATGNTMQPVGSFVDGKEGYVIATTPNNSEGVGAAIQELTPAQRGAASGKYLLISVSNAGLNNLTVDGQRLFKNAAAYLIDGSVHWTPVLAPSNAVVTASPSAAYASGSAIELTASADNVSEMTTYTWYKGDTWAEAEAAGAIQVAAIAENDGNVYSKASAELSDAGTYWCVIVKDGGACEATASLEISVVDASYNISFVSAHGTAPSATTGVSYTLPELSETGYQHMGWTADINVTVDAEEVTTGTTIANGKLAVFGADVTFTAVWAQEFQVSFNLQGYGTPIAPQDIVDGGKVTKPSPDPSESGYEFGGWYKESACTNAWNFATDVVTANTELFAKWTEDPCPDPKSLSKVVLTATDNGTVSGYNSDEYAGDAVIGGLSSTATAEVDPSHEGTETGYKLNNGGSAIVFATLKKGTFQAGDRVVVTITKKQDAYKVEDVPQPILDIYYGTSKDDATFLATIDNVTAAGSYTYRLTAADITAIGTKTGIGVFRPSSGRTQNPYVYSVEIQGCRSWAVTHNVTFDMKDHGTQVDPQVVPEGDHVAKPNVVEPEGWAFVGWYKETTLENAWDFATDVMGTEDITLYAKWESEAGVIKLFNSTGDLNTTNFVSAAKAAEPIEIESVDYPCLADFGSNRTSLAGTTQADVVQYNATTDAAKIKLDLYNNNSGAKTAYLWMVEEGDTESGDPIAIEIPGKTRLITSYYAFNSTKNRSFYVTSGAKSDIKVLQVKVLDNGNAILQFGQAGYSVNFNKGRVIAASNATIPFEGASIHSNDAYSVMNSSNLKPKTFIQFENAVANTTVKIKKASSNAYYVTNDLDNKGTSYTTDQEIVMSTTGTWYIGSVNSGSVAALSKIEFIAPKCAEPAFNALANSELCEGDAFEALDGTATVADAAVTGSISYQWYKGDNTLIDGAESATYTPIADGEYYVIATNHREGYSDNEKKSAAVTVEHFAAAVITTAPLNKRGEVGDEVTLTVAAAGKNVAYKWYTCDENGDNEAALDPEQTGTSINVTITDAMEQWYKVKVTSDCGGAEAMAKVSEFVPATPANVTGSILWDWTSSAWSGVGAVAFTNKDVEELMADADAVVPNNDAFRSDMLYGTGQYVHRNTSDHFFQGSQIRFNNTVAGLVRVHFRSTGNDKDVELSINGTVAGSGHAWQWSSEVEVAAGGVTIIGTGIGGNTGYTRIDKIEFLALADRREAAWVAPGELGTVCLKDDAKAVGANVYELVGCNASGYMVFDQIVNGEIEAGKPYLFEATRSGNVSFYKTVGANNVESVETDPEITKGMYGTFDPVTFTADDESIYYFSGRHIWAMKDRTAEITVPAYRCYVDYAEFKNHPVVNPNPAPGRLRMMIGVNGKNTPTALDEISQEQSANSQKLLINGQLFILRGEKMFDATGRLVK